MQQFIRQSQLAALLCSGLCFTRGEAQARLPKPTQASGVILAVDLDTQCLVFKAGKDEKPFVLDWNTETQFLKGDRQIDATKLKAGDNVVIHYKHLSFRNPLLKKVFASAQDGRRSEHSKILNRLVKLSRQRSTFVRLAACRPIHMPRQSESTISQNEG
jgi:hypothetical protein